MISSCSRKMRGHPGMTLVKYHDDDDDDEDDDPLPLDLLRKP